MKINTINNIQTILIAILSSMLTAIVTIASMHILVISHMKKDAVDKGFAYWKVVDNSTGFTSFTWNEPVPQDTLEKIEDIDLTQQGGTFVESFN